MPGAMPRADESFCEREGSVVQREIEEMQESRRRLFLWAKNAMPLSALALTLAATAIFLAKLHLTVIALLQQRSAFTAILQQNYIHNNSLGCNS